MTIVNRDHFKKTNLDSQKEKNLESSYERIINVGFCISPYEDLSDIIDINPVVFGTTKDEKIFSIEEVDALFKSQFEQMRNMKPSLDRKRIATRISPDGNHGFIVEEITLTLSSPEETNSIFMRASCVMEYHEDQWKLTHWHTSTPVDTENDHWHQEEWKREKEKLQKLVDQQTADLQGKNRELEIEASIERVRAVAMSMTRPEDMLKVCRVISDQLEQFGVEHIRNVQTVIINEESDTYQNYQYFAPYNKESIEVTDSDKNPSVHAMTERMLESPDAFFTGSLTGKELEAFRSYRKQEDQFPDPLLDETEGVDYHFFSIGPGGLGITLYKPLNEDGLEIFKRFHNVFSLAYRRFRDIEKAEAQAREAQIELSLERIRAQVTAMQESSELLDIMVTMRTEFVNLGYEAHYFWHMRWLPDTYQKAMTSGDGSRIGMVMTLPRHIHGDIEPVAEWEKSDEPTYVLAMDTDLAMDYVDKMISLGDFEQVDPQAPTLGDIRHIGGLTFVMARTTHGEIGYSLPGVVPDPPKDAVDTLVRFAGVFDLAYRRFEDLKKAEAQARETQIELALERIRARTMAMQHSDALAEASSLLFQQMDALGIKTYSSGFTIWDEDRDELISWMCNADGSMNPPFRMPITEDQWHKEQYESWKKGEEFITKELTGDEMKAYFRYLRSFPLLDEAFNKSIAAGHPMPDRQIHHVANFSHGNLLFITLEPVPEAHGIFRRFARVFEQTYTRFLDLKNAEAQARESEIQLALERIRARTMAMQKSKELADVASVLFEQLRELGGNLWGTGFGLCEEDAEKDEFWFANENGVFPAVSIPNTGDPAHKKMYNGWKKGLEFLSLEGSGDDLEKHYEYMMSLSEVKPFFQKILDEALSFPEWQQWNAAYFTHGYLLIITLEPYPDPDILKRFARVFDQTYTRFLDLQKAEEQARESEIQLALERVRSKSMAMHKSEELADLSMELVKQVQALGIETWFCAFNIYDDHPDGSLEWGSNGQGTFPKYRTPREGIFLRYYEAGQNGDKLLVNEITEEECPAHYDYLCSLPGVGDQLLKMKDEGTSFPTYQIDHVAYFKYGYIIFITFEPVPESHNTFKRFARVFEQSYTRFLDLQKAEEQAKEAQVEAALERVRAQAMAMHHTEDLGKTIEVYFEQLDSLIDSIIVRCGAGLLNKENRNAEMSTASRSSDGEIYSVNGVIDMRGHPLLDSTYEHWLRQKEHSYVLRGNEIREYYRYITNQVAVPENAGTDELHFYFPMFTEGSFYVVAERELPDNELNIFRRFSSVLSLTYRRFNDLKKAEAQAREAQIEAALERVRSRSLAMHKTDELQDVVRVVAEELKNTGVILDTGGAVICTYFQDSKDVIHWTATEDPAHPSVPYLLPYFKDELFDEAWESKNSGDTYFANEFSFDVKNNFWKYAFEHSDYRQLPEEYKKVILESKSHGLAWAWSENSAIMIPSIQGDLPSEEEKEILIRFAKVFEQAFIRFLDLQKAEEQAREAKIETALEKIRSRTMAMQKGEELQEVAVLLYKELIALGVTNFVTCGYVEVNEDIQRQHTWVTSPGGDTMGLFHLPLTGDDTFDARYAAWKKQQTVFHQSVAGQVRSDHLEYAITTFNSKEAEEMVRSQFPDPTVFYCFNFPHGYLHIVGGSRLEEDEELLLARFTKVFEQTYTRFLDLQKAEEQAREARIETALEKVRSRTMGMQSSDELPEVANLLFLEVQSLGIPAWSCGYNILSDDKKTSTCIMSSEGELQVPFELPLTEHYTFVPWHEAILKEEKFAVYELSGDDIIEHYKYMKSLPELKSTFEHLEHAGLELPTRQYNHLVRFKYGFLLFITYESVPDAHDIFRRFTKVFDQTYTRFLDLKKAEAQTREAQIENALEKVRSRSLAMQHPNELIEVAQLLREEMGALGVEELETSSIYIHDESSGLTQCWFTIKDRDNPEKSVTDQMTIRLQDTWVGRKMDEFYRSSEDQASILMKGDHRIEWIRYCEEKSDLFGKSEFYGESIPERTYHLYKFSNGFLGAASPGKISDESWELMKRATGVFSFAYTRFSDLQKAGESARRARQQASLDRVRADISSMRTADDLNRVTPLVWRELTTLGIPFIRCGVFIIHEEEKEVEVYLSKPDGTSLAVMHLPFDSNELVTQTVESWRNKEVHTQHWSRVEFLDWGRSMMEQGQVNDLKTYQGAEEAPESLHLNFIPFDQGMLYVGSTGPLEDEEINLSESLAKAFSIAYARYEDFVKLEKAKASIEDALSELKATQSQLVQQEKLASLGQLTAGIAHEIKNPLNFVNNFSELSVELVEEAKEELSAFSHQLSVVDAGKVEEALVILEDIEANLRKIHEHGSRADSIVKSMLQHSRGGSGSMEPTDLNAMISEYVNLAFHGMRAGKHPINVDMDMQLDKSIGKVMLIPEDFSRVIVNLCNNAFDAMREKSEKAKVKSEKAEEYQPKLTIRTKHSITNIAIEIEDNCPGIHDELKDKILQPFFTTKKGTAGTGLGLSITNDIIKAHGGSLDLRSTPNKGTIFTINLTA